MNVASCYTLPLKIVKSKKSHFKTSSTIHFWKIVSTKGSRRVTNQPALCKDAARSYAKQDKLNYATAIRLKHAETLVKIISDCNLTTITFIPLSPLQTVSRPVHASIWSFPGHALCWQSICTRNRKVFTHDITWNMYFSSYYVIAVFGKLVVVRRTETWQSYLRNKLKNNRFELFACLWFVVEYARFGLWPRGSSSYFLTSCEMIYMRIAYYPPRLGLPYVPF